LEKVRSSKRIAVPGCHASGFIALVYPLAEAGLIDKSAYLTCHSITGYSGGGKKMIADYESAERDTLLGAPRQYALTQQQRV
jgi:N-acetyl-gamma-glutamyl-phosphate reductase